MGCHIYPPGRLSRLLLLGVLLSGASLLHRYFFLSPYDHGGVFEKKTASIGAGIGKLQEEKCDLSTGDWIPNPSEPPYTADCPFIGIAQNCLRNGRQDSRYLRWKWKPRGCSLPPFDAERFLQAMRGKRWALIGDSLVRNHADSLLCLLASVEIGVEFYHDEGHNSAFYLFPSYNFTMLQIWSPFLVASEIPDQQVVPADEAADRLNVDVFDPAWAARYGTFDYAVVSVGQWYTRAASFFLENGTVLGCRNCGGGFPELSADAVYRRVLRSFFDFVAASPHKPTVLYRSWTPAHYERGEWNTGGICNRTVPYGPGEYRAKEIDRRMRSVEVEEFERAAAIGNLEMLDTYELSLVRPDGHADRHWSPKAVLRQGNGWRRARDCMHWCLPGPIDVWSDLVMAFVANTTNNGE